MGKVAIVGVEGSGKTVLMGALCELYGEISDTRTFLMPENQAAYIFMRCIPHKLRVERVWPEATSVNALKSMRWTLRRGKDIVCEVEMLDYPGELYRLAFGEHKEQEANAHREELNEFLEHLVSADVLVVLLNQADLESPGNTTRNAETMWITRRIFDYAGKLPNLKDKILVLTQADRCIELISKTANLDGYYRTKMPMLHYFYPDLKVMAVSAVDETDQQGRPKEDYSTIGCRELMQAVLPVAEHAAVSALSDSEREELMRRADQRAKEEAREVLERMAQNCGQDS
jgi:hypothetical protein